MHVQRFKNETRVVGQRHSITFECLHDLKPTEYVQQLAEKKTSRSGSITGQVNIRLTNKQVIKYRTHPLQTTCDANQYLMWGFEALT